MRMLARSLAVVAAGALIAAAAACGGSSAPSEPPVPFDQPEVALRNVQLRGVGILGGALDVELHVYNPNAYALESPRVGYRVYLDQQELVDGITDLDLVIPAHDSATVRLPARFSYTGVGRAGKALMNNGAAPYRVLGRITVGTPYGRLSFPYDRIGTFATLSVR